MDFSGRQAPDMAPIITCLILDSLRILQQVQAGVGLCPFAIGQQLCLDTMSGACLQEVGARYGNCCQGTPAWSFRDCGTQIYCPGYTRGK
ncbi:hypothetical protein Dimus_015924 [Dionaea muscipula]